MTILVSLWGATCIFRWIADNPWPGESELLLKQL